ncbi:hypothetical protein M9H77_19044 [Catharanthus roseus]|uniref:Uncharacterized protein n=1 Tax=Catharanthus roseus TaxID=4058 RepID=A0ACC0B976_CATRO|nr:hypothetical protein M9H77_19044 [Catharanthus roseus]
MFKTSFSISLKRSPKNPKPHNSYYSTNCNLDLSPMATRYRTLSRSSINFLKSTISKPSVGTNSSASPASPLFHIPSSSSTTRTLSRPFGQLGSLQSMLPLYSAVSSARLTSCLGLDSKGSRSLSKGMLCSANPGV